MEEDNDIVVKILNFVFALGNLFFIPFVTWKAYTWVSQYAGFELPELTFWNVVVIRILYSIFTMNVLTQLSFDEIKKDLGIDNSTSSIKVFFTYAFYLLLLWLVLKLI